MFRKTIDLFIFSSLYVAFCAVVMIWQTSHLLLGTAPSGRLIGFVFFSTICSYNFHWYLTPAATANSRRVLWSQRHKILHFVLYLIGIIGSGIYFFSLLPHMPALCFAALVTFLYSAPKLPQPFFSRLRTIAVGKTFFLSWVWMYVTTLLPVIVAGAAWNKAMVLFALSRFFLIYAICIVFDYRDRQDDKAAGIRSLITYLNERGIDWMFVISLVLFAVSTAGLYWCHYPAFYILLLLIPGIVLGLLYQRAKSDFSDDLYYIVLDGMVMFSGLLMLIFRI